jgi:aubergine-like protein
LKGVLKARYVFVFQVERLDQWKLEVWPGYVTRVEEKEGGLMLTCDVSHRILRAETAYDVIKVY